MTDKCAICHHTFTDDDEPVECYGCQAVTCDDCARTVTVDPGDFINPPAYEWCCDECHADDQAAAEFAEERAAENRADQRAADREHMDDMRY
jgi:hypothetical protein